jgi:hypothetical protein
MFSLIVVLLIGLAAAIVFFGNTEQSAAPKNRGDEPDDGGWEYGDVWKQGSTDESVPEDDVRYVEILRGDTGRGYDDSYMMDLVGYLGSRGIRATYNSFSLGMEPAAIMTYVLKVEAGKLDEAREYLKEKFKV